MPVAKVIIKGKFRPLCLWLQKSLQFSIKLGNLEYTTTPRVLQTYVRAAVTTWVVSTKLKSTFLIFLN